MPFVIDEYSMLDANGDPERRTAELPLENARVAVETPASNVP